VRIANKAVQHQPQVFVRGRLGNTIIKGIQKHLIAQREKLIAQIVGSIARVQPTNYQQQRAGDYYRHPCCEFRARHLSILRPCFPFRGKPA
jgi:hypothetical protein